MDRLSHRRQALRWKGRSNPVTGSACSGLSARIAQEQGVDAGVKHPSRDPRNRCMFRRMERLTFSQHDRRCGELGYGRSLYTMALTTRLTS